MFVGTASAFSLPGHASVRSAPKLHQVMMSESLARRSLLAAAVGLAAPVAASAMAIPGFNAPGLVKATKVPRNTRGYSGGAFATIRDSESNHFWSPKGMVD